MKIDRYLFKGCGSEEVLRKNIDQALTAEQVRAVVTYRIIDDTRAVALGLSG